ncbi:MAG: hypothetical protein GXO59_01230 [Dictyoglomi bacterium]|nr:hypothetical protein [Dictyoglomota bacterium]
MKYILVDGHSLLFRSYYALPALKAGSMDITTGAIRGFISILLKILGMPHTHMAVALDTKSPTFRHESYEAYKAGRPEVPEDFHRQVEICKELCRFLGIPVLEAPGYEADDIIATIATRAELIGAEVDIYTGDKDLFQLITDRVRVIVFRKGVSNTETYDKNKFIEKYGFSPDRFPIWKALAGDASDNIKGIPNIGVKRATALLQKYDDIEGLLSDKKIAPYINIFEENLRLVRVVRDVPVGDIVSLRENLSDWEKASNLLDKLSIKRFRDELRKRFMPRKWIEPFKMVNDNGEVFMWQSSTGMASLFDTEEEMRWLKGSLEKPPWKIVNGGKDGWKRIISRDIIPQPWSYVMPGMAIYEYASDFTRISLFWHFINHFGIMIYGDLEQRLFDGGPVVVEEEKGIKIAVGDKDLVPRVALAIFETGGKVYAYDDECIWADFDDLEMARDWYRAAYGEDVEVMG